MTHVTRGLTPTCRFSVWLAGYLGYPQGYSMCGVAGLCAIRFRWMQPVGFFIDCFLGRDHCYNAVQRSINRANQWAT